MLTDDVWGTYEYLCECPIIYLCFIIKIMSNYDQIDYDAQNQHNVLIMIKINIHYRYTDMYS